MRNYWERYGAWISTWLAFTFSTAIFAGAAYWYLEGNPQMSVSFQMNLDGPPSQGQVFWRDQSGQFSADKAAYFEVTPGEKTYNVDLPNHFDFLRLDPTSSVANITVRKIVIKNHFIPLMTWNGTGGFSGWKVNNQLIDFHVKDKNLFMRSTGGDPSFVSGELWSISKLRNYWSWATSIFIGLLCALIHSSLIGKGRDDVVLSFPIPKLNLSLPDWRSLLLLFTTLGVCAWGGFFIFQNSLSRRPEPQVLGKAYAVDYKLALVDREGNYLSDQQGPLKLVIDPFSVYRNFPNQKMLKFTTDELGYRGSSSAMKDSRPKVILLGGSAAFGYGLDRDADALDAQLGALAPQYKIVNTGVVGFASSQELSEMVQYADRLKPKIYIDLDGWNDFNSFVFWNRYSVEFGYNLPLFMEIEKNLHSCYARTETTSYMNPLELEKKITSKFNYSTRFEMAFQVYTSNIEKMAAFAKARGATFIMAFQPELGNKTHRIGSVENNPSFWAASLPIPLESYSKQYREVMKRAADFCAKNQIPFINLNDAPLIKESQEALYYDQMHMTARGIKLEAELLSRFLQDSRPQISNKNLAAIKSSNSPLSN